MEPRDIDLTGMTVAIGKVRAANGQVEEVLTITPAGAPAGTKPTWTIRQVHEAGVMVAFLDGTTRGVKLPELKRMLEEIAQPPNVSE